MSDITAGPDIAKAMGLDSQRSNPRDEAIGKLMRARRRQGDRTMGTVARLLRCEVSRISDLEHGYVTATDEELRFYAEVLP